MSDESKAAAPARRATSLLVGLAIVLAAGMVLFAVSAMYMRAHARTNQVALASSPKSVSIQHVGVGDYRPTRSYVGTLQPWTSAAVGPQHVSAYVDTVLVRPGGLVERGDVLATLDCRSSSAASRALASRAKALELRRDAVARETRRLEQMRAGGFASENEVDQIASRVDADAEEIAGLRASLRSKTLEVDDCVLRAPFAGEIVERLVDPGAYVVPGDAVATIIDRSTTRVIVDAPESDFSAIAPGTEVSITTSAARAPSTAAISRRAPAADVVTRTVHFEIDLPNDDHALPVGTTATITIAVGDARRAAIVPLRSAVVRRGRATFFVVDGEVARRRVLSVIGERGGDLYVEPELDGGAVVVVEGRALLEDGDLVVTREITG